MKQNMQSTQAPSQPPALSTTTTTSVSKLQKSLTASLIRPSYKSTNQSSKKTTQDVMKNKVVLQISSSRMAKRGIVMNKAKLSEKELVERLLVNESLIKNLQSEVLALKAELDKFKSLNVELESSNKKLTENLIAVDAKAKVVNMNISSSEKEPNGEHQNPKFKQIQKLIADKLERSKVKKEAITNGNFVKAPAPAPKTNVVPPNNATTTTAIGKTPASNPCQPPPPPPMPPSTPSRPTVKGSNSKKSPPTVKLFNSLKNQEGNQDTKGVVKQQKPVVDNVHSSIVDEIQNRSAHLLAIRADIETKGDFINDLKQKVVEATFMDIEDVLNFVNWLDGQLSSLADERAVLKHFNWPERKADAMREAAVEYRDLKLLEQEILSYKDDPRVTCGASLRKMESLLDKSEGSIQRLVKLRNSVAQSYQQYKIPTAWMLDSGIITKIKQASKTLVKMYLRRVTMELGSAQNSDKLSSQKSLLLQTMHFGYRAHQFAGGLDAETLCAFEVIRKRVNGQPAGS